MSNLEIARSLARAGWHVFPFTDDRFLVKWSTEATTDRAVIRKWWERWPEARIGVHCGLSGLVAVDLDRKHGKDGFAALEESGRELPHTFSYTSRSGNGEHHIYRAPEGVNLTIASDVHGMEGVDIRSGVGMVAYSGDALTKKPRLAPAPEWALVHKREGDYDAADLEAWLDSEGTATDEKHKTAADRARRKARRFPEDGVGNGKLLTLVTPLVSGLTWGGGRREAYEAALGRYMHDYPWASDEDRPRVAFIEAFDRAWAKAISRVEADVQGEKANAKRGQKTEKPVHESAGTGRRIVLRSAAEIVPKAVTWLWDQRVPIGQLTLFAGREGTGKSSACVWTAAHLTRGTLPGALKGNPQNVLIVATEDAYDTTIVPRLIAANADLKRVFFVEVEEGDNGVPEYLTFPQDLELLADACTAVNAAYVIIDPLAETLDIGLDSYKEREVRQGLRPLVTFSIQAGVTLAGIMHFNKAQGDPLNMINGSGGFKNIARSALAFAKDTRKPDGERVMQQIKSSLGRDSFIPWLYSIEEVPLPGGITTARFNLTGEHGSRTVQEIMQDNQRASSEGSGEPEAAQWLRLYMMTQPDWTAPMSTVMKAALKEGFTESKITRAKDKMLGYVVTSGRESKDSSGAGHWNWTMKEAGS